MAENNQRLSRDAKQRKLDSYNDEHSLSRFIYYVCATELGWAKSVVDEQPIDYVMQLVDDIISAKQQGNMNRQVEQVRKLGMR